MKSLFRIAMIIGSIVVWGQSAAGQEAADIQALELDFYSLGAGIDRGTKDAAVAILAREFLAGSLHALVATPWGKEGEVKVCAQRSRHHNEFPALKELTDIIPAQTLVHISVVDSCLIP